MATPTLESISVESLSFAPQQPFLLNSISIESLTEGSAVNFSLDSISIESNTIVLPRFSLDSISIEHEVKTDYLIKIQDYTGAPIENANINYNGNDYLTDAQGFTTPIDISVNDPKTLTITKLGYQDFKHVVNTEVSRYWFHTLNRIVPFVVTSTGTVLNPKANDPNNRTF